MTKHTITVTDSAGDVLYTHTAATAEEATAAWKTETEEAGAWTPEEVEETARELRESGEGTLPGTQETGGDLRVTLT